MKRRLLKKKIKRLVLESFENNTLEAYATIDGKRVGMEDPRLRDIVKRNLSHLWQPYFKAERRRQSLKLKEFFHDE